MEVNHCFFCWRLGGLWASWFCRPRVGRVVLAVHLQLTLRCCFHQCAVSGIGPSVPRSTGRTLAGPTTISSVAAESHSVADDCSLFAVRCPPPPPSVFASRRHKHKRRRSRRARRCRCATSCASYSPLISPTKSGVKKVGCLQTTSWLIG